MEISVFTEHLTFNTISTFDEINMYDIDKNIFIKFDNIITLNDRNITLQYSFDGTTYNDLGSKSSDNLYYIPLTSIDNDASFVLYLQAIDTINDVQYTINTQITRTCKKAIETILYDHSFENHVYAPAYNLIIPAIQIISAKPISNVYYKIVNGKDSEYSPIDVLDTYGQYGLGAINTLYIPEKTDPLVPFNLSFKIEYTDETMSNEFVSGTFDIAEEPTLILDEHFDNLTEYEYEQIELTGTYTIDSSDQINSFKYQVFREQALIFENNVYYNENSYNLSIYAGNYGIGTFVIKITLTTQSGYSLTVTSNSFVCLKNNIKNSQWQFKLLNYETIKTYDINRPQYAEYKFQCTRGLNSLNRVSIFNISNLTTPIITTTLNHESPNFSVILDNDSNILTIGFNTDLIDNHKSDYIDIRISAYDNYFSYVLIENRIVLSYSILRFKDITQNKLLTPSWSSINQTNSIVGYFDLSNGFYIINPRNKVLDINNLYGYTCTEINNSSDFKFTNILKSNITDIDYRMYGLTKYIDNLNPGDIFLSNVELYDTALFYNGQFYNLNNLLLPRTSNLSLQPIIYNNGKVSKQLKMKVILKSSLNNYTVHINSDKITCTPLLYFDFKSKNLTKISIANNSDISITFEYLSEDDIEIDLYLFDYIYNKLSPTVPITLSDCIYLSSGNANYGIIGVLVFKQGTITLQDAFNYRFISYPSDTAFKLFYNDLVELYSNLFILNYVKSDKSDYITCKLRADYYSKNIIDMNIIANYKKAIGE